MCEHEPFTLIEVEDFEQDHMLLPRMASNVRYRFYVCPNCFTTSEVVIFDMPGNRLGVQPVAIEEWQTFGEE